MHDHPAGLNAVKTYADMSEHEKDGLCEVNTAAEWTACCETHHIRIDNSTSKHFIFIIVASISNRLGWRQPIVDVLVHQKRNLHTTWTRSYIQITFRLEFGTVFHKPSTMRHHFCHSGAVWTHGFLNWLCNTNFTRLHFVSFRCFYH